MPFTIMSLNMRDLVKDSGKRLRRRQSGLPSIPGHDQLSAVISGNASFTSFHTNCSTPSKKTTSL